VTARAELLDALDERRTVVVHHERDGLDCAIAGLVVLINRTHVAMRVDGDEQTRTVPIDKITAVKTVRADA